MSSERPEMTSTRPGSRRHCAAQGRTGFPGVGEGVLRVANRMGPLLKEIRRNPLLWRLAFVPATLLVAAFITVNGRPAWLVGVLSSN